MSLDATCNRCEDLDVGTYWMRATCGNCSREFDVELTLGHEAKGTRVACTYCGMNDRWSWFPMPDLDERLGAANPVPVEGGDDA